MSDKQGKTDHIPDYLKRRPELFVRRGDEIIDAPGADVQVAEGYSTSVDKGPITCGKRLTILTKKSTYHKGEQVRVIHVVEAIEPGYDLYVAGPKAVYGEYVDNRLVTEPPPNDEDPLVPLDYDGVMVSSPAVDYNYDITTYSFAEPGTHRIHWKLGSLHSNSLTLKIVD